MTLAPSYQGRKAARFGRRLVLNVATRPESYLWQGFLTFAAGFVFLVLL